MKPKTPRTIPESVLRFEDRYIGVPPPVKDLMGRRAYELFEARGRQPGHDVEDWLQADNRADEQEALPAPATGDSSSSQFLLQIEHPSDSGYFLLWDSLARAV